MSGIALADTIAFTSQAALLLLLLNRDYPGLLKMRGTLLRSGIGALLGGLATYAVLLAPLPTLIGSGLALIAGGLAALPFMLPEIRLLLKL